MRPRPRPTTPQRETTAAQLRYSPRQTRKSVQQCRAEAKRSRRTSRAINQIHPALQPTAPWYGVLWYGTVRYGTSTAEYAEAQAKGQAKPPRPTDTSRPSRPSQERTTFLISCNYVRDTRPGLAAGELNGGVQAPQSSQSSPAPKSTPRQGQPCAPCGPVALFLFAQYPRFRRGLT